jgi:maleate isomerase
MYGRRGRIGLIVLDSDLTIEPDLRRLLPEGVEIHAARVVYPRRVNAENMAIASDRAIAAVEQLLPIRPAAIAWACTSGSFYQGREGNERLLKRLQAAAGDIPVTTASDAVVAALKALDVSRPAVGAPYSPEMIEKLERFLREHGMTPTKIRSLFSREIDDYELQDLEDSQLVAFVSELGESEGDSVVLSCTGLATAAIAPAMEPKIGKPIISSNRALLWRCWTLGRISAPLAGDCRLFRTLSNGLAA